MLVAGDEFGQTQHGNNNPYCQDNELTWLNWKDADTALQDFVANPDHLAQDASRAWTKPLVFSGKCGFRSAGCRHSLAFAKRWGQAGQFLEQQTDVQSGDDDACRRFFTPMPDNAQCRDFAGHFPFAARSMESVVGQ